MSLGMTIRAILAISAGLISATAGAQLLPGSLPLPNVGETVDRVGRGLQDSLDRTSERLERRADALADLRLDRLRDLVRAHPNQLEMTDDGPAVRGQVIAIDPSPAAMETAREAGFVVVSEERIEGLDLTTVILETPRGWSVDRALRRLRRMAPGVEFAANHIHSPAGSTAALAVGSAALAQGRSAGPAIGLIDGGVAEHPSLRGTVEQRGFVRGAPRPSAHGTAVASLASGSGSVRGASPGTSLIVADIYGNDPAGGSATALVRALAFMIQRRVPVVALSLVGPSNPLVARAVSLARSRGMFIVAAVGNDGPAAPPAYPASYPGVIAVTAVDGRNRLLVEAGRAAHLDYAAPGADMAAAAPGGGLAAVRGTSYAVPLVAGRLYRHSDSENALALLDAEAAERDRRGFGRGLVCGTCRTPLPRR